MAGQTRTFAVVIQSDGPGCRTPEDLALKVLQGEGEGPDYILAVRCGG